MPNVSQRDSTTIPTGGEVSARHTNHLRNHACGLSSFFDRRIRDHQILGGPTSPHVSHWEEAAMLKIIKGQKLWSENVQDALVISVLALLMLGLYFLAAYLFMRI